MSGDKKNEEQAVGETTTEVQDASLISVAAAKAVAKASGAVDPSAGGARQGLGKGKVAASAKGS